MPPCRVLLVDATPRGGVQHHAESDEEGGDDDEDPACCPGAREGAGAKPGVSAPHRLDDGVNGLDHELRLG